MRLSCFVLKLSYFCSKLAATLFFFFPSFSSSSSSWRWTSWLKVLAYSTNYFHFPRSWIQAIQFFIFIWQIACLMLSSHLYLGLPRDFLVRSFQLNIFLTVLVSGIHCTWPNQLSFVLQTCSYFLHFVPGAELHSWKFWPSQQTLSTSLDPGHGLSSYLSSFGRFPVRC